MCVKVGLWEGKRRGFEGIRFGNGAEADAQLVKVR